MTREILVNSSMYEIAGQEFLNISSALNYDKVVEEELLNILLKFKFLKYHHFFKKNNFWYLFLSSIKYLFNIVFFPNKKFKFCFYTSPNYQIYFDQCEKPKKVKIELSSGVTCTKIKTNGITLPVEVISSIPSGKSSTD